MRYVGGGARETGCIFCSRLVDEGDAASLILWRGAYSFIIMNLFPYNTGHVMLVPNAHVASPETANPAALVEIATAMPGALRALRRALNCDGFNVGTNVGSVAGAGVAEHLHQHVVPRWTGDANFMPILSSTMVLPELIPITYAKLRAELDRELGGSERVSLVILSPDGQRALFVAGSQLPDAVSESDRPLWRTASDRAADLTDGVPMLLGWAGPSRASATNGALAFSVDAEAAPRQNAAWVPVDELDDSNAREAVARAQSLLPPHSSP
ncbi:MAG: HIT domain-containing protein [Thermomicrobiales bacterium]|nr:HIT domain-containing protein [Thermomicrobiales bacterium]